MASDKAISSAVKDYPKLLQRKMLTIRHVTLRYVRMENTHY